MSDYHSSKENGNSYITFRQSRLQSNKNYKKMHDIKVKGSIFQEDITFLNIYVPNNRVSKYVRQN